MIATATPVGNSLNVARLVIPGNATIGQHTLSLSCSTTGARFAPSTFHVVNTTSHLTLFSTAMPSLGQLGHNAAGAGGIGLGMLLISRLISAGFPSEWLDSTYEANRERFHGRAKKRFPWAFRDHDKVRSQGEKVVKESTAFIGFILVAGLINSFLDPGFGFNLSSLWLLLGQSIGIAIFTMSSQLSIAFGGIREKRRIHLQVLIGGLIIAVLCVAASRALGLSPGYCYGLIAVFVLTPKVEEEEWGKLHGIASLTVLVVSTAAMLLRIPVYHWATGAHPSPIALMLVPALDIVFIAGFSNLAFGMFPLPFLPGRHMAKWNRPAYYLISFAGLLGFICVLLSPGSGSPNELRHIALVPLLAAFVIFAGTSLGLIFYFRAHPHHGEHDETEAEPEELGGPEVAPDGA
jgi:hypothetical protein